MLDEDKIRVMTKLAVFDKEEGNKAEIASHYYKNDYISYNMIWTGITTTVAYVLSVGLCFFCKMEYFLNHLQNIKISHFITILIILYLVILVVFETVAFMIYRKRYDVAQNKIKSYCNDLKELEKIYNKEHLRQTRAKVLRNLDLEREVSHDKFTGV